MYADSVPPRPVVNVGIRTGDSITVKWVKGMDKKDQGKIKVQILVGYGLDIEPVQELFTEPLFTVNSFPDDPGNRNLNTYTFKATQAGGGKFRIQFIDARGSVTTSADRGSF